MPSLFDHSSCINNPQIEGTYSIKKRKYQFSTKKENKILRTKNLTYELLNEANILFNEYIESFKDDSSNLLDILYNIELTGALIYINNIPCIIVEERKNSIIVIYKNNETKTFVKNSLFFYLCKNNVKYGFIAKHLKLNRFTKK